MARRAEFTGADDIETTLRREHDEAAARLAQASEQLAADEAAVASLSERTEAAQQTWFRLSALAERVSATVRIATERAQYLETEPAATTGPDPDELDLQADEMAEQERQLAAEQTLIAQSSLKNLQDAEHVQGVDLVGIGQEDLLIGGLGLVQPALLVQRRRLAEGLGQHGRRLRVTRIEHCWRFNPCQRTAAFR